MSINRARFVSPVYQINPDYKKHTAHHVHQTEENSAFANEDEDNVHADFGRHHIESDIDHLHVTFNNVNSTVNFERRPDLTFSSESFENDEDELIVDDEVEMNVSTRDDPSTLVLTFRSWTLGLIFTCALSFVNQFFWYRTSPLFVGTLVAQLLTYPIGKTMARILPNRDIKVFRWRFNLNPGPFTIKEHCIITAMANATCVSLLLCLI